jgi:membrane associated rhomboid family serine protease
MQVDEEIVPIAFDPADNLVQVGDSKGRLAFLSYVPWYTLAVDVVLIGLFYGVDQESAAFGRLELDTAASRQAWRWLTYGWFHFTTLHLWVNVCTWSVYCGLVEVENGWWRTVALSQAGIVAGAFGCFWQRRLVPSGGDFVVVGTSGGIYSMIAVQIGFLALQWRALGTFKRIIHLSLLIGAVVCDVVVDVVMYDPQVSYASHVAGFVANAFLGLLVLRRTSWVPARVPAACGGVWGALMAAGAINAMVGF